MRGINPGEVWMVDLGMAANVRSALLPPSLLQQIAKFFHRHPGIFYYPAHRQSVHRVVTRYGDEMRTVAHDNVFALADNLKSRLFERLHGPEMGIHRAGAPVDGLHGSHGDATERSGDRESIFGIC